MKEEDRGKIRRKDNSIYLSSFHFSSVVTLGLFVMLLYIGVACVPPMAGYRHHGWASVFIGEKNMISQGHLFLEKQWGSYYLLFCPPSHFFQFGPWIWGRTREGF